VIYRHLSERVMLAVWTYSEHSLVSLCCTRAKIDQTFQDYLMHVVR